MAGALERDNGDAGDKGKVLQKRRQMLRDAIKEAKIVEIYFNKTSIQLLKKEKKTWKIKNKQKKIH